MMNETDTKKLLQSCIRYDGGNVPAVSGFEKIKEINSPKRNIKVDLRTWNALNNLKGHNETFNDIILSLLGERTKSVGGTNLQMIKYARKTTFFETVYADQSIGIEFEYNDIKNKQADFTLDLKLKKVFFDKKSINPSFFFGVDNSHKHFNQVYLNIYLKCVLIALKKELGIHITAFSIDFEKITYWRKLYYDYSLSEDSFINDIEEPLRSSVDEKPDKKTANKIKKSPSNSIQNISK